MLGFIVQTVYEIFVRPFEMQRDLEFQPQNQ